MIKRIFNALASAARLLLRDWRALIILFVLYLAMLGAVYLFFVTREATVGQLILSLLLALAATVLFLIIQTMAARYRSQGEHAWKLFLGSLRDSWKLLVMAVPLILVAVLALYLFGKFDKNAPVAAVREALRSAPQRPGIAKPQPIHWQSVVITALKYLLFFLVLPLAAIHLWIATANSGLKQTLKSSPRILARALAPQAVITYVIGFVFFAVVPYFLIVTRTQMTNAWLDFGLLTARLILAAALSLIGWVVTVGALGQLRTSSGPERIAQPGEANAPAEA
jgi:hypothetical protein